MSPKQTPPEPPTPPAREKANQTIQQVLKEQLERTRPLSIVTQKGTLKSHHPMARLEHAAI